MISFAQADLTRVNWVTVRDVHNEDELRRLLNYFGVDEIILPDILDEGQVEFETEFDDCLYLEYMLPYLDREQSRLVQSKRLIYLDDQCSDIV